MQLGITSLFLLATMTVSGVASAQPNLARDRASAPYRLGFEHMRAEAYDKATEAFQDAIDIDPTFELAHYMLGRTRMYAKDYARALAAFIRAHELYINEGGRYFSNVLEAQRHLKEKTREIDEYIRQLQLRTQTREIMEQIRQLNEYKRRMQEAVQRGSDASVRTPAPAFVSLSLGSAYFRVGNLAEAEKAYKETIAVDPKAGEAFNNLAVVYLETGRAEEAEKALKAAEKTGFKVHPQLKAAIVESIKRS